jgi:hypothetical protein
VASAEKPPVCAEIERSPIERLCWLFFERMSQQTAAAS